jgi:hypothetical protein
MRRTLVVASIAALSLGLAPLALAKKKGGGGKSAAQAPSARALGELAGKFKWGMSSEDVIKVMAEELREKFQEKISKERDVYTQDKLRKEEKEEVDKIRASLHKFDGKKSGWDTSLIEREFVHNNNESMLVLWEQDQRRFLFFWNDKLYKQFIAFNAEHPVFAGKSFDDFANILQNRYGRAEMKLAAMKTKDEAALDHLEWPASGDYTLWAVDQSHFYGNFCISLMQTSTLGPLASARGTKGQRTAQRNTMIDAITAPAQAPGDPNADIVDDILGKKGAKK